MLLTNVVVSMLGMRRLHFLPEKAGLALYYAVMVGLAYIPSRQTYLATRWKLVEATDVT